jgi:general secretion pathway protein D
MERDSSAPASGGEAMAALSSRVPDPDLNTAVPQVVIEAKFVEFIDDDVKGLGFDWFLGETRMSAEPDAAHEVGVWPGGLPSTQSGTGAIEVLTRGAATLPPTDSSIRVLRGDQLDWPGRELAGAENMRVQAITGGQVTGILTESQFRRVLEALEKRRGGNLMAFPRVTTLSGRQARISSIEVRRIVNFLRMDVALDPEQGESNAKPGVKFNTTSIPVGPTLDVIPNVTADGQAIELILVATVTEFLGDEGRLVRVALDDGDPMSVQVPLLTFRVRQAMGTARILDGQTVVLGGMTLRDVQRSQDKVPVLGDVPLMGRLFRSEREQEYRQNLLVFVTATIIDAAGNPIRAAPP